VDTSPQRATTEVLSHPDSRPLPEVSSCQRRRVKLAANWSPRASSSITSNTVVELLPYTSSIATPRIHIAPCVHAVATLSAREGLGSSGGSGVEAITAPFPAAPDGRSDGRAIPSGRTAEREGASSRLGGKEGGELVPPIHFLYSIETTWYERCEPQDVAFRTTTSYYWVAATAWAR
jgi:hypothetical protein